MSTQALPPPPDPREDDDAPPVDHRGDRTPPQDNDAERQVLGSMMLSADAIIDVVEVMRPGDYYRPAHERIHNVIIDMWSAGEPVDWVTVGNEMSTRGLGRDGDPLYLHSLVSEVPVAANAGYYAEIVRDLAGWRRMIETGTRLTQAGYSRLGDIDDAIDRAEADVMAILPQRTGEDYRPVATVVEETINEIEAIAAHGGGVTGVPTGFIDLDELTNGLHPGQMAVVAARPAMGKSTLALDFMRSASIRHGMASVIFSLEMTRQEITTRLLSAEAKVSMQKMRSGHLGEDDWARVAGALPAISQAPLFIDDSPNMTMGEIRAKARRLKREHDLRFITIDYMQLMTSGKRVENRQVEVSEFSRQIKLLAKELELPVVALSQLNRGPEQRTDKRPMLSDLRESGSIEQDADIVILLNREDMYAAESTRPGEADLIVAKHRNGPTRDIALAFQGHYSRFVDMAQTGYGFA